MADTVAVMNKGRIEQLGAPEQLYELPHTVFVANFLGQSNLFTGTVAGTSERSITIDAHGVQVVIPSARAQRHAGTVTVGVRPEKVRMLLEAPEGAAGVNVIGPGRVTDVSFSGVSTQYLVAIPGIGTVTVFAQNTAIGPIASEGAEVWLTWQVEHGFGLADDPADASRFSDDTDTAMIAAQRRAQLEVELEGG